MTKKDYNYMAAMEKAVAEKYGKEAVQDFRSQWTDLNEKQYLEQLRARQRLRDKTRDDNPRVEIDGIIIRKKVDFEKNNRTCPICKTYSFSSRDDLYMNRFESCHRCYIDFVEHREDRWNKGWKPTEEQVMTALTRRKKQWLIS